MQPTLEINLDHLLQNYLHCQKTAPSAEISAVVKANAYGLGAITVTQKLSNHGCKSFFVATIQEALEILPHITADARIHILNGVSDMIKIKKYPQLSPVINTPQALQQLKNTLPKRPYWLHLDTGMSRLGMQISDFDAAQLTGECIGIMSHLACADTQDHPMNAQQYERFHTIAQTVPQLKKSLSASGGLHLGSHYHFDMVRPGIFLYGGHPDFAPVIKLKAPLIQKRMLEKNDTIGYGSSFIAPHKMQVGILAIGYADGLFRSLSRKGSFIQNHQTFKILGRISMDLCAVDLSALSENALNTMTELEILNNSYTINNMADDAETIPYEILTNLGHRFKRTIVDNGKII